MNLGLTLFGLKIGISVMDIHQFFFLSVTMTVLAIYISVLFVDTMVRMLNVACMKRAGPVYFLIFFWTVGIRNLMDGSDCALVIFIMDES